MDDSKLITTRELTSYFRVTRATIVNWTRGGLLTAYKIGGRKYYKDKEVLKALMPINEYRRIRNNNEDYQNSTSLPYYKIQKFVRIVAKFCNIIMNDKFEVDYRKIKSNKRYRKENERNRF